MMAHPLLNIPGSLLFQYVVQMRGFTHQLQEQIPLQSQEDR